MSRRESPLAVVVMGVSGSGKSTIGAALADRLHVPFIDGDTLHPLSNRAKMASGGPLEDADRRPWLDAVGSHLALGGVVVACSALRRAHRDRLRCAAPDSVFVLLHGSRDVLASRMSSRVDHFMPVSLLDSQLATLELPAAEERVPIIPIDGAVGAVLDAAYLAIRRDDRSASEAKP